jgi:hypothetical protein
MKRMRILGLALVGAFALAAIGGVSMASATTAKFGSCVSVKKGVYEDSNCAKVHLKKGVPDGKGKFEFKGAGECYGVKKGVYEDSGCTKVHEKKGKPDGKGKFEKAPLPTSVVTGGTGELVSAAGTIKCTSSSGSQAVLSPTTLTAQTIFHGCETKGQKCQNTATEGEIATFALNGVLVSPTAGAAAINLTGTGKDGLGGANEGKYLAEFGCTLVAAVRVHGQLGGNITPVNVMGTTETTEFVKAVEQGLIAEFGPPGFPAGETLTLPSEQLGNVLATSATSSEVHVS